MKLLAGEVSIAKAQNVLMFSPVGDLTQGISGILSVTNFKLSFITTEETNGEVRRGCFAVYKLWQRWNEIEFKQLLYQWYHFQNVTHQQNNLYGYTDTCLSNIHDVYIIIGDKKRRLHSGSAIPSKVEGIFIVCKVIFVNIFFFFFSMLNTSSLLLLHKKRSN